MFTKYWNQITNQLNTYKYYKFETNSVRLPVTLSRLNFGIQTDWISEKEMGLYYTFCEHTYYT